MSKWAQLKLKEPAQVGPTHCYSNGLRATGGWAASKPAWVKRIAKPAKLLSIRSARSAKQKVFSVEYFRLHCGLHRLKPCLAALSATLTAQHNPTPKCGPRPSWRKMRKGYTADTDQTFRLSFWVPLLFHLKSNDQLNQLINKFTRIWKSFRELLSTEIGRLLLGSAVLRSQHLESKAISGLSPAQTHLPVCGCPNCNWDKSDMEKRASNVLLKMKSVHFDSFMSNLCQIYVMRIYVDRDDLNSLSLFFYTSTSSGSSGSTGSCTFSQV